MIGDMTGFAAAAYQRGVHFIQVPTTVMSQVWAAGCWWRQLALWRLRAEVDVGVSGCLQLCFTLVQL